MERDLATDSELTLLRALARQFPNVDAAMAEIARLSAIVTLPKGTVHVISDVHGEAKKLRHIINNASGTLRPLAEKLFAQRMDAKQFQDFRNLVFYPQEFGEKMEAQLADPQAACSFAQRVLSDMFEILRVLCRRYPMTYALAVFPPEFRDLFIEILHQPDMDHGPEYIAAVVEDMAKRGRVMQLIQ